MSQDTLKEEVSVDVANDAYGGYEHNSYICKNNQHVECVVDDVHMCFRCYVLNNSNSRGKR